LADITQPKAKFGSRHESSNDSAVNSFAVTPVEGHDTANVPRLPVNPDQVLALLKARLALDDTEVAELDRIAGAQNYQSALAKTSTWPPKENSPSSPDITPSPMVIGIDEIEAMTSADTKDSNGEYVEEAEQRNTPAEPVASARVRQLSNRAPPFESQSASRNSNLDLHSGSVAARLYFPPTKPPESWQVGHADEPLVQIVPDCDAKTRTVKSLRRNPYWPNPSDLSDPKSRPSVLLVSIVAVTLVLVAALLSASWNWKHSVSATRSSAAKPTMAAHSPTPAPSMDSGIAAAKEAAESSRSAEFTPLHPPPEPSRREQPAKSKETKSTKGPKALAPNGDGLVF